MRNNESLVRDLLRRKWVRVVLIIDGVALIILLGAIIYNVSKVSAIIFNITPIDATISINGNTDYANGTYKISPGSYEVQISHEGLETKTLTVNIEPHHTVTVTTFLKGTDNNFGFYELKANEASYNKLREIASAGSNITTDQDASAESFISAQHDKHRKLIDLLPINYTEYEPDPNSQSGESLKYDVTIKESKNEDCEMILCIEALMLSNDDQEIVEKLLAKKGIKIDDYEVIYKKY